MLNTLTHLLIEKNTLIQHSKHELHIPMSDSAIMSELNITTFFVLLENLKFNWRFRKINTNDKSQKMLISFNAKQFCIKKLTGSALKFVNSRK